MKVFEFYELTYAYHGIPDYGEKNHKYKLIFAAENVGLVFEYYGEHVGFVGYEFESIKKMKSKGIGLKVDAVLCVDPKKKKK